MFNNLDRNLARRLADDATQKGDFATAAEIWDSYRQAFPMDLIGWTQGITVLWKGKLGPEAQHLASIAVEKFPDDQCVSILAAQVAMSCGEHPLAENYWRRALRHDVQSIQPLKGLAECLVAQQKWDDAEVSLKFAMGQWPNDLSLAAAYANVPARRGLWEEAERRWHKVTQDFPGARDPQIGLIEAIFNQRRLTEAADLLADLPPLEEDRRTSRLAARVATAQGNWAAAERLWEAEAAHSPLDSGAWQQWAIALTNLNKIEQAKEVLNQAVLHMPSDMYLYRALAQNAMVRRNWAEAADYWQSARDKSPHRLDAWMYIVHLRRLAQQDDLADAELVKAMQQMVAHTDYRARIAGTEGDGPQEIFEFNERTRLEAYTRLRLGWPEKPVMEVVTDALIMPQDRWVPRGKWDKKHPFQCFFSEAPPMLNGGVYDADGRIVRRAIHYTGMWTFVPDALIAPGPDPDHLHGRWLFGGIVHRHIGHFLVEGTGRLWALNELEEDVQGVVYFCGCVEASNGQEQADPTAVAEWVDVVKKLHAQAAAQKILTGGRTIHIIARPTRVDELIVPSQLVGYAPKHPEIMDGHPLHRSYLRSRIDHLCGDFSSPTLKIYVSRASLPIFLGFMFREDLFEENMRKQGYTVIHPETILFPEQLKLYRRASHIVIGAGSACHVLALAATERHRIALLGRERDSDPVFAAQLRSMGAYVAEVNATLGNFQPVDPDDSSKPKRIGSHRAVTVVDWREIWSFLEKEDFVSYAPADDGQTTDASAMSEILSRLEQHYRIAFEVNFFSATK